MIVLSASQLDHVRKCVRSAALHYTDHIRSLGQDTFPMDLGKRIHEITCAYVRSGAEPDLYEVMVKPANGKTFYPGQIASAAFPLLVPNAGPGWYTETSIKGLTLPGGIPLTGDIDLAIATTGALEIRDYKSTSDFRWAKTESDLREDIQANLYAYAGFCAIDRGMFPGVSADVLDLHWQYLRTSKPASHSVRVRLDRAANERFILRLERETAKPWVQLRLSKTPGKDLPPLGLATGRCSSHNGCPYRGTTCQVTVEDTLRYQEGMKVTTLQELLAARTASGQALTQVPPPASLAPAPTANPFAAAPAARPSYWMPGDPMNEDQEYFKAKGKPLSYLANIAENPPPPEVSATYDLATVALPAVEAGVINPPEAAGMKPFANEEELAAAFPPAQATPASISNGQEMAEFAALKAECDRLGLNPEGKKLRTAGYRKLLLEHKNGPFTPTPSPVPESLVSMLAPAPFGGTQVLPVSVSPHPVSLTAIEAPSDPVVALSAQDIEAIASRAADLTVSRLAAAFAKIYAQ